MGISRGNCSLVQSLATCSRARETIAELAWEIPRDRRFSEEEKKGELNRCVGSDWRERKTFVVIRGGNILLLWLCYLVHCPPAFVHTACRSCWHGWVCHVSLAACSSGPHWRPVAGWQCGPAWAPHNHSEQHWGPSFYLWDRKNMLLMYNNTFIFLKTHFHWYIFKMFKELGRPK